jgi:hypothetical protein
LTSSGFAGPLNGTVGATTANTGSFTTLTTSSTITDNGGTANGVAYLNGSKVLTSGSALTFDGANLGVGVTPSAWSTGKAIQVGTLQAAIWGAGDQIDISGNAYFNSGWKAAATKAGASLYEQALGVHSWSVSGAVTAGQPITFTQAMTLDASGNLMVGQTSSLGKLTITQPAGGTVIGANVDGSTSSTSTLLNVSGFGQSTIASIALTPVTVNVRPSLTFSLFNGGIDNLQERMRIDSSGNLGVGTTGQVSRISSTGSSATDFKALTLRNSNGTVGSTAVLNFEASAGTEGDAGSTAAQIKGIREGAGTTGALAFWTSLSGTSTERMRIDSSGNLLVGTTNSNPLGNGGTYTNLVVAGSGYAAFDGVTTATASGSAVVSFAGGTTGASSSKFAAAMNVELDALSTTNATGRLVFYTATGGTTYERARIDSSGVLLVGTTTTVDGRLGLSMDSGTNTWQVGPAASSGVTQFYITKKASGGGVYLTSTSATSWSSASDINLKNITGKIENALNAVSTLTPARYTWKADETNTPQVGLIAQEIQKVLPEVIGTDINGNLSIRYTEVIPLLVGAIQEQQALIQDLTTRLAKLEAK